MAGDDGTDQTRVTIAEAASILDMPVSLVTRRLDDGRLASAGGGAARTCSRADVEELAVRERATDAALREMYDQHEAIEAHAPAAGAP